MEIDKSAEIAAADVYFNLHLKLWSVRDRKSGLVAVHGRVAVFTHSVTFPVSEAGRKRVLEEKRKNVHAYVRGMAPLVYQQEEAEGWESFAQSLRGIQSVSYNPYRGATFYERTSGEPVNTADSAIMVAEEGKPPRVYALGARWE